MAIFDLNNDFAHVSDNVTVQDVLYFSCHSVSYILINSSYSTQVSTHNIVTPMTRLTASVSFRVTGGAASPTAPPF